MIGSRLSDPDKLLASDPAKLDELQNKISSCMSRLFRKPVNGGNPFLFAYAAPKPHELHLKLPDGQKIETAATDGRKYYWNPSFLEKLTADETSTVMEHEGYHVAFFHPKRGFGKMGHVWNIAVDYTSNACILSDRDKTGRNGTAFGGNLGKPLAFKDLLAYIDGTQELPDGSVCFADVTLFGRSPESIYDEIVDHWNKSPRKCPVCGGLTMNPKKKQRKNQGKGQEDQGDQDQDKGQEDQGDQGGTGQHTHDGGEHVCKCPCCGSPVDPLGSMDSHIDIAMTPQEVHADLMRARDQATQMRGMVPAGIEDVLGELVKPTLKFTDIVRNACFKKVQDAGLNNDWKRLRRRFLTTTPRQYLPRRYMHRPRWLAALDTSGSMQQSDMEYGISQLQVLGSNTDGTVVPMDVTAKWKDAARIENAAASELIKKVKCTGRGGTDFTEFFANYRKNLGSDYDVIVVLTDGDCGTVPIQYKPPNQTAVVWVLTRNNTGFVPPFGRVAHLRTNRP